MFNPIGDDKVGSLEIMIDGHPPSTAWYNNCPLRCVIKTWEDVVGKGRHLLIEEANSLESIHLISKRDCAAIIKMGRGGERKKDKGDC